jgi:hypothetical protein
MAAQPLPDNSGSAEQRQPVKYLNGPFMVAVDHPNKSIVMSNTPLVLGPQEFNCDGASSAPKVAAKEEVKRQTCSIAARLWCWATRTDALPHSSGNDEQMFGAKQQIPPAKQSD